MNIKIQQLLCAAILSIAFGLSASIGAEAESVLAWAKQAASDTQTWTANIVVRDNIIGAESVTTGSASAKDGALFADLSVQREGIGEASAAQYVVENDGLFTKLQSFGGTVYATQADFEQLNGALGASRGIGLPYDFLRMFLVLSRDHEAMLNMFDTCFDWTFTGEGSIGGVAVRKYSGALDEAWVHERNAKGDLIVSRVNYSTVKLALSADDGFPREIELRTPQGGSTHVRFSNVELNPQVDESLFTYTLSDDAEIRDETDRIVDMLARIENREFSPSLRAALGAEAKEIVGTNLEGETIKLSDFRGKVVLVDFWATWCGPCVAELPHVAEIYERYHDAGLEVIGVSMDHEAEPMAEFLEEHPEYSWPQIYDGPESRIARKEYGVWGIPCVVIVDREGIVRAIRPRGDALDAKLAEVFGDGVGTD